MMKSQPKYEFQAEVREFLRGKSKVGIFAYYGSGKTYQSLQWITDNIELGEPMLPAIVLVPKNIVFQWQDQIRLHSHFTSVVVEGSLRERREALDKRVDFYIVNYGAIRTALRYDLNTLAARAQTIIVDESTYIKSSQTLRFKLIQYNFVNIPHRAILTGKPITEKPQDLWSQMLFLDGGQRLGRSYWQFMTDHFSPHPFEIFKKVLKDGAAEKIANKVKDICVYVPREKVASQLPPRTMIPVYFEMDSDVRKQYEKLRKEFRLEFESGTVIDTQWAMVKSAKLHQMCQGFMYVDAANDCIERFGCEKFDWLEDSIEEILAQGPVLLWGFHKMTIIEICKLLEEMKLPHARYMGGDTQEGVQDFINGKVNIIVLSESAAFAGFNFYRARSAIFVSQGYSGDMRENALARNFRSGSEIHDSIIVYDLMMKNSIDDTVYSAVNSKADVADAILKHITMGES